MIAAVLGLLLLAGCGGVSPGTATTTLATGAATSPAASTAVATESTGPSMATAPSPSVTAAPSAATAVPPDASLGAEGGDAVVGQLGTYRWSGGGSDSPWLPGAPIGVGVGEPLTVHVAGGPAVASWSARRTPADASSPTGAIPMGSGDTVIAFDAPGDTGSWTVEVTVSFIDGSSAAYAWRLDVS